jgi:ferredoxin
MLGFLKGIKTECSITFDETRDDARFTLINGQHLTTAAANDEDYSADPRCFAGGPIPVECRTAACGACWVGVLGGREAVAGRRARIAADQGVRLHRHRGAKPHIRLACMAQASGNVTIVIPPWNGIFGKFLKTEGAGSA